MLKEAEDIIFEEKEDSEENSPSQEIPKEERILKTQAYDKSVRDLISMIDRGDIIMDPDYQRNYVWDNKRASLLVESILMNVPIPVIYVSENEDSSWSIIDGLQRLYSLQRFYSNELKLSGLEVLQELKSFTYHKLSDKARRILDNGILRIILIFKESHPEIKYDIFMRLNRGAVKLNEQELRNCLYRGKLNDGIKAMRNNSQLLDILGIEQPHYRMRDAELVLRYLAFLTNWDYENKKLNNYKGRLKTFLNEFMLNNNNISEDNLEEFKNNFAINIDKVYSVFGKNAFRRIDKNGEYESSLNRAIMDFIMISFNKHKKEEILSKKDGILNLLKDLPQEDAAFEKSISDTTSNTNRIEYRISKWDEKFSELF